MTSIEVVQDGLDIATPTHTSEPTVRRHATRVDQVPLHHQQVDQAPTHHKDHVDAHKSQCQELSEEKTLRLTHGPGKSDFIAMVDLCAEDQSSTADGLSLLLTVFTEDLLVNSK